MEDQLIGVEVVLGDVLDQPVGEFDSDLDLVVAGPVFRVVFDEEAFATWVELAG